MTGPSLETTNTLESPPLASRTPLARSAGTSCRRGEGDARFFVATIARRGSCGRDTMHRTLAFLLVLLPSSLCQLTRPIDVPSCHLPAGRAAVCVPIAACSHLASLVGNLRAPLPRDVALLLRDSFFCSGTGSSVQVCCPVEGKRWKLSQTSSMSWFSGLVSPSSARPQVRDRPDCAIQDGPAECVAYNVCSPFIQLLSNLKKPLHPVVPTMVRSSYLCGREEDSSGRSLPKVCCPSAALVAQEQAGAPSHPFSSHPALRMLAPESTCGPTAPNVRIVGGQDASLGQYPWLVNLGYQRNGAGETLFKCGGSLIGPRHVVTAAHCVTDLPSGFALAVVRVGEHDLASEQDCQSGVCSPEPQDMKVKKIVFHPSYGKPNAFQNDIAVISLEDEVQQNDFVIPVCLPFNDEGLDYLTPEAGEEVDVAGWGATTETGRRPATVLQFLGVRVTNGTQCKEVYAERGGVLTESQICAGGQKGKV